MKRFFVRAIVSTVICIWSATALGQPQFDIQSFNQKFETAQWLYQYDIIAWWTSDSILAAPKEEQSKLGGEWFCFQEKDIWHAAYGKYVNDQFEQVFHYTVDTASKVRRVYNPIDTFLANSYSRALRNANRQIKPLKDTVNVRFNQFIKRNDDQTLSIWLLPAFSQSGVAVYGGEFYYKFDPSGQVMLDKTEYFQGQFKGFKADNPREIWLNYRDVEKPTLGAIFFVWYYKKYFTRITIDNKPSNSTVLFEPDKGYYWIHVVKD
ncbi:hypothetical protein [Paraflavitalea sp. CAU 1676]|uniref:hypothetical protein n=1 Tax=Paraflavitalea sp. CAU 1676 TaxID=3032598 RepID=UPI0023DC4E0B|nr:hypothetical protein [Paraflavitalea sp. CAU 1676]MDF2187718.1 hypothetical protein [Paraflavitalea sp. CAU 1676]